MKRIFAVLTIVAAVSPIIALAQTLPPIAPPASTVLESCTLVNDFDPPITGCNPGLISLPANSNAPVCCVLDKIAQVTGWIFAGVMLIAVIFLILGAYTFVTAAGDPTKVTTGRNYLIYALIGIGVAFLARGLVSFVVAFVA